MSQKQDKEEEIVDPPKLLEIKVSDISQESQESENIQRVSFDDTLPGFNSSEVRKEEIQQKLSTFQKTQQANNTENIFFVHQEKENEQIKNENDQFKNQNANIEETKKVQQKIDQLNVQSEKQENSDKFSIQPNEPNSPVSEPEKEQTLIEQKPQMNNQDLKNIIKNAEMQRIGGTFDFFRMYITNYQKHMKSRRTVIVNIYIEIQKRKNLKCNLLSILKEYFQNYAEICTEFHQKSYKFVMPERVETENKFINIREELKAGMEKLVLLRRSVGNDVSRLQKFISSNTMKSIEKAFEVYFGTIGSYQKKLANKKDHFEAMEKKMIKRIEKIGKLYTKGRFGLSIEEDLFVEMLKFVKDETLFRESVFQWGKEMIALRKTYANADYALMIDLDSLINEFQNYNDTVYQSPKRKFNFLEKIKKDIKSENVYSKICLPTDSDYILSIFTFLGKKSIILLSEEDYEQFLTTEYFDQVIGKSTEFLKGAIMKSFQLKNQDEELIKTVSGNLVVYNKKSYEVKEKHFIKNSKAVQIGSGKVELREIVKGIIFDSEKESVLAFKDDDRAEELVMELNQQILSAQAETE